MRALPYYQLVLLAFLAGCGKRGDVPDSLTQSGHAMTEQAAEVALEPLTGRPDWFPLGEEVYHASEIEDVQGELLSFVDQSRWFSTDVAYPNAMEDIATDVGGSRLELCVKDTDDPATLRFSVTLSSTSNTVLREFEHRWNNVLPLLFAFYVDGVAVRQADLLRHYKKWGGVSWRARLLEPGESKTWEVSVKADSIFKVLQYRQPHTLSVVAAFSEYQHDVAAASGQSAAAKTSETVDEESDAPILVVRSEPAHVRWDGENWSALATQ